MEDYLEAILRIIQEKQAVRATDIGKRLKVSRSSVTGALHALADRGLINYAPYDVITLTDAGRAAAEDVAHRHESLRDFFTKVLAVEPEKADDAACKMEHAIPEAILERFVDFVRFVERCPRGGPDWIEHFGRFCDHQNTDDDCENCVREVLEKLRRP